MSAPTHELFRIEDYVDPIYNNARTAAGKAYQKAYEEAKNEALARWEDKLAKEILYCYDESHSAARFDNGDIREYNGIADSLGACFARCMERVGEPCRGEIYAAMQEAGNIELIPGGPPLRFQTSRFHYAFFCLTGEQFCRKLAERVEGRKRETEAAEERRNRPGPFDD